MYVCIHAHAQGTEYFDGKLGRYVDFPVTDVLQMIGRAGRPQYDTQAGDENVYICAYIYVYVYVRIRE